jgi:dienelactone hydrolase
MTRTWFLAAALALATAGGVRAQPLEGTKDLAPTPDPAAEMLSGLHYFADGLAVETKLHRRKHWNRDTSSPEAYAKSVEPNRARLRKMLGVVDARVPFDAPEFVATVDQPALVGRGAGFEAFAVRWPVFEGVDGEGLLLVPTGPEAAADIVAIPDADQTPEALAGLTGGMLPDMQFARQLAEGGSRVLIPTLIDRSDEWSVLRTGKKTHQPHREFVYRPAFQVGRTIIGYEVQKVLAAVDWFAKGDRDRPIGVIGYGEGGLVAFFAGALDTRIDVTCVSGYFGPRDGLWEEPIYRNVFGLLREFGDAEVASLIAPRRLVVEPANEPVVAGPPLPRDRRSGAAPGAIRQEDITSIAKEVARARSLTTGVKPGPLIDFGGGFKRVEGGGTALGQFVIALGENVAFDNRDRPVEDLRAKFDPKPRMKRQLDQLVDFTQRLVRESEEARRRYWAGVDRSSPDALARTVEPLRQRFHDELIGRIDLPLLPPNARTRRVYDQPKHVGYEVKLDVFEDVFASGVLLMPKDLKPGERRPVVVCQHGLEGRPADVADANKDDPAYHAFAAKLADRGFITYAPQNPYLNGDRFRSLQRKLNPLGLSLFSLIVPQHQQTVDWLGSLPFVDKDRVAFYGLSYGGKTAMRVPPLVKGYCLSICSGDFNEWVWKTTSLDFNASYVSVGEYEMFEWNLANTFNYAEMAALIAPRPFMIERGHHDGVAPDEWVAYEYAKVRRLYADLKIPERTTIEFFDGPHTINGKRTFEFLHHHLKWPKPAGE